MCQVLELSESNQDILAKFMGHDIRIHREFYRLPDSTLELAKVAKVLHLINTGEIAQYKNKNFDEIEFDNAGNNFMCSQIYIPGMSILLRKLIRLIGVFSRANVKYLLIFKIKTWHFDFNYVICYCLIQPI